MVRQRPVNGRANTDPQTDTEVAVPDEPAPASNGHKALDDELAEIVAESQRPQDRANELWNQGMAEAIQRLPEVLDESVSIPPLVVPSVVPMRNVLGPVGTETKPLAELIHTCGGPRGGKLTPGCPRCDHLIAHPEASRRRAAKR